MGWVWDLGFGVWVLGFGVWGSGLGLHVELEPRPVGSDFRGAWGFAWEDAGVTGLELGFRV